MEILINFLTATAWVWVTYMYGDYIVLYIRTLFSTKYYKTPSFSYNAVIYNLLAISWLISYYFKF